MASAAGLSCKVDPTLAAQLKLQKSGKVFLITFKENI